MKDPRYAFEDELVPGDLITRKDKPSDDHGMYLVVSVDDEQNKFTAINLRGDVNDYNTFSYGINALWWKRVR